MPSAIPKLLVSDISGTAREVDILRIPFTIGRQSDNDLVLLDSRISRRHARILQDANGYSIEDAGSRHGTRVNEKPVKHCERLRNGDRITLGMANSYGLSFKLEDAILPAILERFEVAAGGPAPQLQHLSALLQMARMLNHAPALEEVLTTLLDTALRLTNAERGLLFLAGERGQLHLRLARDRRGLFLDPRLDDYSSRVVERVAQTGLEEVALEEAITGLAAEETAVVRSGARGIVAMPLLKMPVGEAESGETLSHAAPQLLGILYFDSRSQPASVTSLDREVLQALASEGATVIENARLLRIARQQERNLHELALARSIQQGLLPRQLPQASYFELHALTMSCQTVGGDYYDVVPLSGGRFGLTVADVSGKGLPAAMMAVTLQGVFSGMALADPGLSALLWQVNNFLCERTPAEMYATLFYGVVDPLGNMQYINAGHVPPILLRADGDMALLANSNFPLGLFAGASFEVESLKLLPGDRLLVFSDGVTEAQNPDRGFFGDQRVERLMEASRRNSPLEICQKVVMEVQDFAGKAPQADDITVLCFLFKSLPGKPSGSI
jgi:sigma-B regulation protein RsbU (phosphoserine phosphatase)